MSPARTEPRPRSRGLLDNAGVLARFSKIVSVDSIRTFKPDPAVYEYLVAELRRTKRMVWLISSNPFDVIGAKACGLRTAWVQRDPKRVFDPWEFEPDLVVHGLAELPENAELSQWQRFSLSGLGWSVYGNPQAEACATICDSRTL